MSHEITYEPQNLMEGLLSEMNRVREVIKTYEQIPAGVFAASMMKLDIQRAEKAIGTGDTIEMTACYKELKEIKE